VGLVIFSFIFKPTAIPFVRQVFPLPSSPRRATTAPALIEAAIRFPMEKVSSSEWVSSVIMTASL